MERIIGQNSHGFKNEYQIEQILNNKNVGQLNINFKKFIEYICKNENIDFHDNIKIKARKVKGTFKSDLIISLDDSVEVGVSVKMGSGNSVHQEKVETFIEWAKNKTDISEIESNSLRLLIWADGTIDGSAPIEYLETGRVKGRFSSKEFAAKFPEKLILLNKFFDRNKEAIIDRVLFKGKSSKNIAEYIYKGTVTSGVWISRKEYLKYFIENEPTESESTKSTPCCGRLSYQSYNADLKGTVSGAKKRGDIQFKYPSLEKDLSYYESFHQEIGNLGTREGEREEYLLSASMNKNKNHRFWKAMKIDTNSGNYYVVTVEGNKFSQNVNKFVRCKSDNFVIRTKVPIPKDDLLENEYIIKESYLNKLNRQSFDILPDSGISVKRPNSNHFTITKLTRNSFINAFERYLEYPEFIFCGLVLYHTKKSVSDNYKLIQRLGIEDRLDEFFSFFKSEYGIVANSIIDEMMISQINKKCKIAVVNAIENNQSLKLALFTGKGFFDAPYYINYVLKNGELSKDVFMPYYIDNGSGRSKGNFTIIIKPK